MFKDYKYIKKGTNKEVAKRVLEHYHYLADAGYNVIFTALQGSQNYGLDEYIEEYTSDVDTKSIVLPSFEDFVYNKSPISEVEILDNNEHAEVKDIRLMFEMFRKMNISYIELLYSDYIVVNPKYKKELIEMLAARDQVAAINKNQFLRCIKGMALEKQKALCHPYPSLIDKIEKYGYDGKQLSHAERLYLFLYKYLIYNESIEECYKVDGHSKTLLMNTKKQLDSNGDLISCELAVEIMNKCIENINQLVEEHLTEKDEINIEGIDILNNLKYNILKKKFKEEV